MIIAMHLFHSFWKFLDLKLVDRGFELKFLELDILQV